MSFEKIGHFLSNLKKKSDYLSQKWPRFSTGLDRLCSAAGRRDIQELLSCILCCRGVPGHTLLAGTQGHGGGGCVGMTVQYLCM